MAGLSQNGVSHQAVTSSKDDDGGVRFDIKAGASADELIRALLRDMERLGRMVTDTDISIVFKPKGTDGA